uniref:TM7S3/TM198-like domain-containing protein n=1 Tax=Mycena chlorophos TaxID=658473 RepID=A0ABQ0L2S2_MYCCL|nr:predicted protein [Mycena chlorophos]
MVSLRTVVVATIAGLAAAQSSSSQPTPSPSVSLSLSTSSYTTLSRSGSRSVSEVVPTVVDVSVTIHPSSTTSASASSAVSASASASASAGPDTVLATKLDPAFGVLGAVLIITGVPSAFFGHKNRWTSFFLIGFYTLSLVCFVLILKFGILNAVNPPSKTLRGLFVLASAVAGIAGGGISIFFWKASRYFIGGWGGFALALWVQCFHDGGVIRTVGFRWIFYIGCGVVGFILCTIPKIHYHILLMSTAIVGSSAFMLGVDCFTTAGLKEFYIWNLGFRSLFPKYVNNGIEFPVSQTMQIELGLIGAITLMGIAVQLRVLTVLQRKLQEIAEEQKKRDEEAEIQAAGRFATVLREREEWEKDHPTMNKHGRQESGYSSIPLMKDHDGSASPVGNEHRSSTFTLVNEGRVRHQSAGSEFLFAPTPDEELARATRNLQAPGALPALDLGLGIKEDVPRSFIARDDAPSQGNDDLKRKQELEAEIQTIRRSIDALKSETPAPSSSGESRRPSFTSRRTLSIDAGTLLPAPAHTRPPRENDPRARVHSMELSELANSHLGASISRPTSVPLHDDWDTYVQERKLLQPPAGVTPPITPTASSRMPISPAVADALNQRRRRESALGMGETLTDSSEDVPLARIPHARNRSGSGGNMTPVTILPPRKPIVAPTPQRPQQPRTKTFEELNERHREKMRDLQAPLTNAARENADLEAAKQRWEKAKALEREAVTRRQAEKAALVERRKDEGSGRRSHERGQSHSRHSRSVSADKLGGSASKRLSTMKVEDWQRYQQQDGAASVPFPGGRKAPS